MLLLTNGDHLKVGEKKIRTKRNSKNAAKCEYIGFRAVYLPQYLRYQFCIYFLGKKKTDVIVEFF